MRIAPSALCLAAACLVGCVGVSAQQDRVLGLVRGENGAPIVDAALRVFALPQSPAPWSDVSTSAPVVTRSDARGRFSLPLAQRAAILVEAGGLGVFCAAAAPGVPALLTATPSCTVQLDAGATGAHVRIDGVPIGFVAGERLCVPAGDVELLVEHGEGAFVASCRARSGGCLCVTRPVAAAPRLVGLPAEASVVLPPWPGRRFGVGRDGVVVLPAADRPSRVRVEIVHGGDRLVDELWLAAGEVQAFDAAPERWQQLSVLDANGEPAVAAEVRTLRCGPGAPALRSLGVVDQDGRARWRSSIDEACVVISADGSALAVLRPADLSGSVVVVLQPERRLSVRVVDEDGRPLPDALVTWPVGRGLTQRLRTDGRGGAELTQLADGPVRLSIDHAEHVPQEVVVDAPGSGPFEVALETGVELRGRVSCADRGTLDDVLLEVRDGAFRRRVPVAADGSFAVRGLPRAAFDLFAWRVERGVTWSGQARDVVPGEGEAAVVIACDDPAPGQR